MQVVSAVEVAIQEIDDTLIPAHKLDQAWYIVLL